MKRDANNQVPAFFADEVIGQSPKIALYVFTSATGNEITVAGTIGDCEFDGCVMRITDTPAISLLDRTLTKRAKAFVIYPAQGDPYLKIQLSGKTIQAAISKELGTNILESLPRGGESTAVFDAQTLQRAREQMKPKATPPTSITIQETDIPGHKSFSGVIHGTPVSGRMNGANFSMVQVQTQTLQIENRAQEVELHQRLAAMAQILPAW